MSNLRDRIRLEIEQGNLSEPFTVDEVRRLLHRANGHLAGRQYDEKHVGTILANHSIGPGDRLGEAIKRGGERLFIKHSARGTYSLNYENYELEDDGSAESNESLRQTRSSTESFNVSADSVHLPLSTRRNQIAEHFVAYLREKPFRIAENANGGLHWYPAGGAILGWKNRVDNYRWNGIGWAATNATLATFIHDLNNLEIKTATARSKQADALAIYNAIKRWGNPKGIKHTGKELLGFLQSLWTTGTITAVDSTLTKLYAFARPNDFVIYDSRVAAALMTTAEDIYRRATINKRVVDKVETTFQWAYGFLGRYNGTGGTRQRGCRSKWPIAYRVVEAQMEANDLCQRIVECLNRIKADGKTNWTMREVEAVLFMEGY